MSLKRRHECHEKRRQGLEYTNLKGKRIRAKDNPALELTCKCTHDCASVSHTHRMHLFTLYRTMSVPSQKAYIYNLIDIVPVLKRYGISERRQVTAFYRLVDEESHFYVVCRKTFMNTFGLSEKMIRVIIDKKKMCNDTVEEKRGGTRRFKFGDKDFELVRSHINSIPREESHYGREKNEQEFLSSDLDRVKLFKAFQKKHPKSKVSWDFYKKVLLQAFPNLSFRKLRVDTCKTCDRLQCIMKASKDKLEIERTKAALLDHHTKASTARAYMKVDIGTPSDKTILIIDLQQVLPLPTLTHSDMYYLRQLSHYNFGIHAYPSNAGFMNLWNEAEGGRGSTEISTCIFNLFNNVAKFKYGKDIIFWSDNCVGQNKNKYVIFMYMYMVHIGLVTSVEHKFVATGHSYLQCDRDFGLIEKKRKNRIICGREELEDVIREARNVPFEVINMNRFLDFKNGADFLLNITKLALTSAVWIRIDSVGQVKIKRSFDSGKFETFNVWKRGKTIADLDKLVLQTMIPKSLSAEKKKDIRQMLEFIPQKHREYYTNLL